MTALYHAGDGFQLNIVSSIALRCSPPGTALCCCLYIKVGFQKELNYSIQIQAVRLYPKITDKMPMTLVRWKVILTDPNGPLVHQVYKMLQCGKFFGIRSAGSLGFVCH